MLNPSADGRHDIILGFGMHKNTAIFIGILAVIAALLVGLYIGRSLSNSSQLTANSLQPAPSSTFSTSPAPSTILTYSHPTCQVAFDYDPVFSVSEESSDSAILINKNTQEKITLLCGVEFPKPPLPPEKIADATVAGQPAVVYHDASAKDGTPVDVVVFNHPKTELEVALFGFGEEFQKLLKTVRFQ